MAKKSTKKSTKTAPAKAVDYASHHVLTPKHEKLSEEEKAEIVKKYSLQGHELPRISSGDAALAKMDVKIGDVIRVTRKSQTAGETIFYRGVFDE